jgi:hypothetical protein
MVDGGNIVKFQSNRSGAMSKGAKAAVACIIAALVVVLLIIFIPPPPDGVVNLKSIEVNPQVIQVGTNQTITVTAIGSNGHKLKGAIVDIEGAGVAPESGTTGDGGTYTSKTLRPSLPSNEDFGSITITVTYTGFTKVVKTTEVRVTK